MKIKEIEKFGKILSVSDTGLVWNSKGKLLKRNLNSGGYPRVTVYDRNGKKTRHLFVHHLVTELFVGPRPDGYRINHKDLDRGNPIHENLEYMTNGENVLHEMGITGRKVLDGRNHARAKFSEEIFDRVVALKGTMTTRSAAAMTGISKSHVQYIWSGKVKR